MRNLSARERLMLSLVGAAVVAVLFYLFVYTPQTQRGEELSRRLQQQETELARLQRLAETREQKEREFQALSDRIRLIEAKLPPEREIPNLIRQLQAAASEVGVKLMLLRP
ncbi:MAG: type II secretion system protein GspM, partial [Armatimonadota bacterium]|nr:type II secretion system protein GspM [Armatimonadota bacterium]